MGFNSGFKGLNAQAKKDEADISANKVSTETVNPVVYYSVICCEGTE